MSVSDILAQAPLLLSTILSKQKNMGQPPLVPFLTTFKPLETGDIVIEVSTSINSEKKEKEIVTSELEELRERGKGR